jgi:MEMO1 family protein
MSFGPIVAGRFYTADSDALAREIDEYLDNAKVPPLQSPLLGVVSPHAGYMYSGSCAAYSYKALKQADADLYVIIGVSHQISGSVSVLVEDSYRTPLGDVEIDKAASLRLIESEGFINDDSRLFAYEHSIEVQLPFLQRIAEDKKVMLISMSSVSRETCQKLAVALAETLKDRRPLYIASSDMSHFHDAAVAKTMDSDTLKLIEEMKIDELAKACVEGKGEMCGIAPVMTLLYLANLKGEARVEVLKYSHSGETGGPSDEVVGYGSVAVYAKKE